MKLDRQVRAFGGAFSDSIALGAFPDYSSFLVGQLHCLVPPPMRLVQKTVILC